MPRVEVLANKQKIMIDSPGNFGCIVPEVGIKVEVPSFFEINKWTTRKCVEEMSEKAYVHIATGPLMEEFFHDLFYHQVEGKYLYNLPATKAELMDMSDDIIHGFGLIVLMVEHGLFNGENIYLNDVDSLFHPQIVYHFMTFFNKMFPGSQVATKDPVDEEEKVKPKRRKKK